MSSGPPPFEKRRPPISPTAIALAEQAEQSLLNRDRRNGEPRQWTTSAYGPYARIMPTKSNPKFWDRWKLAGNIINPRWYDSMRGKKVHTIIQLESNVVHNKQLWPVYAYERVYAREWHVVDWSGIDDTVDPDPMVQYYYGLQLRYGHPDGWDEDDTEEMEEKWPIASGDRNVYRIGPPPAYPLPEYFRRRAPQTQYIDASFGERVVFDPDAYDSIVTHELPPVGYFTMWQEKEDIRAHQKAMRDAFRARKRAREADMEDMSNNATAKKISPVVADEDNNNKENNTPNTQVK